jgi:hypothetical protein
VTSVVGSEAGDSNALQQTPGLSPPCMTIALAELTFGETLDLADDLVLSLILCNDSSKRNRIFATQWNLKTVCEIRDIDSS